MENKQGQGFKGVIIDVLVEVESLENIKTIGEIYLGWNGSLAPCQSPYFFLLFLLCWQAYLLNTHTHTLFICFETFATLLLSSTQHSVTMLIPSLLSFSP